MRLEVIRVIRRLLGSFRFSATVIASVAMAVASILIAAAVFEAVVLRDMAVKAPERLLSLRSARNARGKSQPVLKGISFPDLQDVRTALPRSSWSYMAAWKILDVTTAVSGNYQPLRVAAISGEYFQIASAVFLTGRGPSEEYGGVAVSEQLWRSLVATGDTTEISIYSQRYRITGVLAHSFRGMYAGEGIEAWMLLSDVPRLNGDLALLTYRELEDLNAVVQAATADEIASLTVAIRSSSQRLAQFHDGSRYGWHLEVARAQPGLLEHLRTTRGQAALAPLLVLICVLLVAATNIANLFLVRSSAREAEQQLRLALGITRRQLLLFEVLEQVLLGIVGLSLGLLLGTVALRYLAALPALARWDLRITGISVILACGAALLFVCTCAILPSLRLSRLRASDAIRRGYGITRHGVSRIQRSYLIVQFTFALGFTCVAVQLASAVRQQSDVDVGFDTAGLYVITGITGAPDRNSQQSLNDLMRVTSAVSSIAGVVAVSASVSEFFIGYNMPARPLSTAPGADDAPNALMDVVGPGYFSTLGLRLIAGREFGELDRVGQPPRIIVNETLARAVGGGTSAIGKTLYEFGKYPLLIIGVAPNVRTTAALEVRPVYYRSLTQSPLPSFVMYVRVRSISPAAATAITSTMAQEVPESGGRLRIHTASEQRRQRDMPARTMFFLTSGLALVALLIAALGLYSVASFATLARRREHGIRAALGASPSQLASSVVREGVAWTALAAALSLPFVWAGTRLATSVVVGVRPIPLSTTAALIAAYFLVAFLALTLPAHRTASVNPADALRQL